MVVGDKKFGVVSYVTSRGCGDILRQKIFCIFPPLGLKCERFLKHYTVLHCALDRPNLQLSTCMVCLCKYQNWVTQGVGSLLNLDGLIPTKCYDGWRKAGK
jgi:hypothetical protein